MQKATTFREFHVHLVVAVVAVFAVIALPEFGHTAALDTPEMLANLSGLVLSRAGVDCLGEQGAVGALGNAVTLDHVGVEGLALWVVLALAVVLVVFVGGLSVVGADVAALNQRCQVSSEGVILTHRKDQGRIWCPCRILRCLQHRLGTLWASCSQVGWLVQCCSSSHSRLSRR